jgi:hypothetical protein
MSVPNRLAREGEELIAHRFLTGAIGLASPSELAPKVEAEPQRKTFWAIVKSLFAPAEGDQVCAVCVPPGARLELRDIPQTMQQELGIEAVEQVTFTQISPAAYSYRDAVRFQNGRELLLQHLREGQHFMVLELSLPEAVAPATEEQPAFREG